MSLVGAVCRSLSEADKWVTPPSEPIQDPKIGQNVSVEINPYTMLFGKITNIDAAGIWVQRNYSNEEPKPYPIDKVFAKMTDGWKNSSPPPKAKPV